MIRTAFICSLYSVAVAQQYQNFPMEFSVERGETPKLSCSIGGGTCFFDNADFSSVFVSEENGGIVQSIVIGGVVRTAWGPQQNFATDFLMLPECLSATCSITCQEVCTCELNGSTCTELSRIPTPAPAPTTPAPVAKVECSAQTDVSACPVLMQDLPVGVSCDCHNFCNGEFLNCAGGNVECVTDKPDGDMMGTVLGCTHEHRMQGEASSDVNLISSRFTASLIFALLVHMNWV